MKLVATAVWLQVKLLVSITHVEKMVRGVNKGDSVYGAKS